MIRKIVTLFKEMVIKFHKGSKHGATANTGSSRIAINYIDHEDEDRLREGKEPFKYMTATGERLSSEEAIQYIDGNSKGLCKEDYKFYLAEVCPSKEEIQQMGQNEKDIYETAMSYMEIILNEYADNFHRKGLKDRSNLVVAWKPHYIRGKDDEGQFHIHVVISHKTQGLPGKQLKISPISNHRNTDQGPIKGGFDRKAFIIKCEKLFDVLTGYERKVADTFEYVSTMKRGSVEQKAEQAEKIVNENAQRLEADIKAGIERRRKNLKNKAEIEEIAKILGGESVDKVTPDESVLASSFDNADLKNKVLSVFANKSTSKEAFFALAAMGISCTFNESADGVEGLIIEKRGRQVKSEEVMSKKEHGELLDNIERITGCKLADKVREQRAQKEMKPKVSQHTKGKGIGR